jgi:predicted Zn-dependent protease
MLEVMRILKETASSGRQPEILSTHPLPETRIEAIKDHLEREYPNGIPDSLSRGRRLPHAGDTASR